MREKYFQEHFLFISSRPIFHPTTRAATAALRTGILSLCVDPESLAVLVMFLGSL